MPKEKDTMHVQGTTFDGECIELSGSDKLAIDKWGIEVRTEGPWGHQSMGTIPWQILQAAVEQAKGKGWLK